MELRKKSNRMVPKIVVRSGSRKRSSRPRRACSCSRDSAPSAWMSSRKAAGVARRTLYNQFASKEEIFREMLLKVSGQLEHAFPPGVETQGGVEEVLRLVARDDFLELNGQPEYLGFLRMVVADSRQFPWIAEEFAAVMDPQTERLARYVAHLTAMGVLECDNPALAAHQFMGIFNEFSLWPLMIGRKNLAVSTEEIVEETIQMFLNSITGVCDQRSAVMTTQRNSNSFSASSTRSRPCSTSTAGALLAILRGATCLIRRRSWRRRPRDRAR